MLRSSHRYLQAVTMAQSWRLQELLASCSNDDIVFSRRVPNRGSSFFAWPGLSATDVANGMLQMPNELRTAHVVFGRPDVPLDLALDIDEKLPIGKEFRDTAKVRAYQRKCLEESLLTIHKVLKERGEKIDSQVVLLSPNLHKLSFHVHIKLANRAFKDFQHLGAFVKSAIAPKVPKVDTQIYRQNGSLRVFQSKKEDNTCAMTVYDDEFQINIPREGEENQTKIAKKKVTKGKYTSAAAAAAIKELELKKQQEELANKLTCPHLSPSVVMLHSFIVRPAGTFSEFVDVTAEELESARRSTFNPAAAGEGGQYPGGRGNYITNKPKMPLTLSEAILNARTWIDMLPEELAVSYSDWIRVGLYAYRIGIEFEAKFAELYTDRNLPIPDGWTCDSPCQELLRAWINFSKRCPTKYRVGDCEQRWAQMRKSENVPFYSAYCNLAALANSQQQQ